MYICGKLRNKLLKLGEFILLNIINRYRVPILWTLSLMIFVIGVTMAQFKPFNAKESGILIWFSFNSALLAMFFSAMKKKSKNKIIFCIVGIVYITIKVILRFI